MKPILTLCCLLAYAATAAFAAKPAPVSAAQLQRSIWQEILNRREEDPALKEIKKIVQNHQGNIRSLAKELLHQDPGCCIHAIWYKEGTFLIVRLIHDTGSIGKFFMAQSYTPNEIYKAQGKIVYNKKTEEIKQINKAEQQTEIYQSLIPAGMVLQKKKKN